MRALKFVGAATLVCAAPAALACDFHGMGENRYFAFASMMQRPSAESTAPAPAPAPSSAPAEQATAEPNPQNRPSLQSSSDTATEGEARTEIADTSSSEPSTNNGDPTGGDVFR